MIVISLDFGTCFSSCGFVHGDDIVALKPREERDARRIPSVFYFNQRRGSFAGTPAVMYGNREPDCMVKNIKKRMEELQIDLDGKIWEPRQITREIMTYLIQGARDSLRDEFGFEDDKIGLILTVPVTFSEPRKALLKETAESVTLQQGVGTEVIAVIPEPVAAAIEYWGLKKEAGKSVLIYDLGGGTFDVAIVQAVGEKDMPYRVIDQDGKGIGGNDWDEEIYTLLVRKLSEQLGSISEEDRGSWVHKNRRELLNQAREIKEKLTDDENCETDIYIRGSRGHCTVQISREDFEQATRYLLDTTIQITSRLLRKHKVLKIDEIVLVGGSCYMPQVEKRLKEEFPEQHIRKFKPELAISLGAARYAKMLETMSRPVELKATHTYGIGVYDEEKEKRVIDNMIFKGDVLPVSVSRNVRLLSEGPASSFVIFESDCGREEQMAELTRGEEILRVTVWRDENVQEGSVSTETLELTENNILKIIVTDKTTNFSLVRELSIKSRIV